MSRRIAGSRGRRRPEPLTVGITGETIRLGQLLKLADLVESGTEAKEAIAGGEVTVNGEVETRRGRQLRTGDRIERAGHPPVVIGVQDGDIDVPW